ncbi:OmpH family outer membrane protein [Halomonas piscis]|uniref:OmpH family outer membrane protein n=1 Tax=Halomonas piscis TaxID=3031727 RepID=A0ABY9Z2D8_9GAMM|nr:OmpH family outer membrane protein [Halomonas piscis]WNK20770.1 OmpH family outer membrane protein [Halomonas piscis]
MRKLIAAVTLFAMTAPTYAAEVAVLDWRAALMNTDSAQSSLRQLESEVGTQQSQAKRLGDELQRLQQRLQDEGDVMSDDERQRLIEELQQKGSRFESLRREVMTAQQRSEQQFLKQAEPTLEQAVDRVIERHGIDILVEPQGVLHSSMDLPNLTEEVTQEFNSLN